MDYPTISDIELKDKSVILRAVLNVPMKNGVVTDEYRIDALLPTLEKLVSNNCKIVIVGFAGRPDGKRISELSIKSVAETLSAKVNKHVEVIDNFRLYESKQKVIEAAPGEIFMLENIRFYPEEESEDEEVRMQFAKELSELGEVYINDAFADHREQASTYELAKLKESKALGENYITELRELDKVMNPEKRPYVAVIGGAKLSEKIDILNSLGEKADKIIIGGAMAYTFLKHQGHSIGSSLFEEDKLDVAAEILQKYGDKIELPIDHVVAKEFNENSEPQVVNGKDIPEGYWGLDIGPDTAKKYAEIADSAETIMWNGPMGVFEWENFAEGTRVVGSSIADTDAYTLVGGGDTVSAVNIFDLEYGVNHICTGGGAMMKYLAKGTLKPLEVVVG